MPILDPVKNVATKFMLPMHGRHAAQPRARATPARSRPCGPSAYWGEENIWDTRGQQPQLDVRPEGPRVARRDRRTRRTIRRSARRARVIRRRRRSRSTAPTARSRCSIRRPGSTPPTRPASPRIICSSATTPTTRCGRDGGGGGCRLAQHQDVRRDRRRREVAGLDGARARHQRQRQARRVHRARPAAWIRRRTCASTRRSTR